MSVNITFKGSPLTLSGKTISAGEKAPDFKVVDNDLKEVSLQDFSGKIKIITSFPSLDTPVCDLQVKEFNKRAAGLSRDVVVIGISMDLPFAQKRFCSLNEIKNVSVLSDYRYRSFSTNYGLLIKELALVARSVMILDKKNIVRYLQVVSELTTPPDYERALSRLEEILQEP